MAKAIMIMLLLMATANAEEPGVKVKSFLVGAHLSEPFVKSTDVGVNFVGAGGTITFSKFPGLEIDLSLGERYFECVPSADNKCRQWTFAFQGQIKWYPWRK